MNPDHLMGQELTWVILLAGARIVTAVGVAPLFCQRAVPWMVRAVVASILTLAVVPSLVVDAGNFRMGGSTEFGSALFQEAVYGLVLGGSVALVLSASNLVGEILSSMSGQRLSGADGETESEDPSVRLFWLVTMAMYVLTHGPELFFVALLQTFEVAPPGAVHIALNDPVLIVETLQHALWLSLQGAGPAIACFLSATLMLAVVQRVVPQFNLFFSGLNSNVVLFWLALLLTISGGLWMFNENIAEVVRRVAPDLIDQKGELSP